jgi:hypothetical protein
MRYGAHPNLIFIFAAQYGGAIIVGEQTITYHRGDTYRSIAMDNTEITCYCAVDTDGRR